MDSPQLGHALEDPIAVRIVGRHARKIILVDPLQVPDVTDVQGLIVVHRVPGHDPVEVVGETLGLHQALLTAGRASFEVGVLRILSVVSSDHRLAGVGHHVDGAVAKVDLRLPVVKPEGGAGLRAAVVSRIAVGHRIPFGHPVVGEIEIPVLPPVSPSEKPAVPLIRKRKLNVIVNRRADQSPQVALPGSGAVGLPQFGREDGQVWNPDQGPASRLCV